ncbi:hypothetical protein [Phosphitispora fastidiosa]|uniref:hypothetical protein n=1 Tax=Phosphitispora fastidiosa TaxID=2837202 RepID=UPI001E4E6A92|nr:hypothetical protein [Phosphitispora fastidiosa]MBU7006204.1 hypothetical protein [Phosphitispora fastidiosa]
MNETNHSFTTTDWLWIILLGFLISGCPRGSFLAKIIDPLSRKGRIPAFIGSHLFRYGLLVFLFTDNNSR